MTARGALVACAEITRVEARNFHYGLRLLPEPKRSALYAIYAWMRVADDVADAADLPCALRAARLDALEARTRAALNGVWVPTGDAREDAVMEALVDTSHRYPLQATDFFAALEGQRMDLAQVQMESFAQTEHYCECVASSVGRLCLDVWGLREGADGVLAREASSVRGVAFQLTNILRDLREDFARGRVYLPKQEFASHGLTIEELLAWKDDALCARFMHLQCSRAERLFAQSAVLDAMVSSDAVPTIRALTAIYRGILRAIARDPRAAMVRRARLTPMQKSWIALRARFGLLGVSS